MKLLLIGFLITGSLSSYAQDCKELSAKAALGVSKLSQNTSTITVTSIEPSVEVTVEGVEIYNVKTYNSLNFINYSYIVTIWENSNDSGCEIRSVVATSTN